MLKVTSLDHLVELVNKGGSFEEQFAFGKFRPISYQKILSMQFFKVQTLILGGQIYFKENGTSDSQTS
jgi:hypothetical protein